LGTAVTFQIRFVACDRSCWGSEY